METIASVNSAVNSFVWGVPAMICIVGVGLLLSFRTNFIQFQRFGAAMKETFGRMFHKKDAAEGAVTPFQAVCTALAADGRYGQYCRCGRRYRHRRSRRSVLDVVQRIAGHMYQIR